MPSDQKKPGAIRRIVSYPSTSVRPEENRLRREGATMGALGTGAGALGTQALRQGNAAERAAAPERAERVRRVVGEKPVREQGRPASPKGRRPEVPAEPKGKYALRRVKWEAGRARASNPVVAGAERARSAGRVIASGSKTKAAGGAAGLTAAAALYGRHAYTKGQPNRSSWYG